MRHWLHELPLPFGVIIVCAAFVIPTVAGSLLVQRHIARLFLGEKEITTVLGYMINAFAVYFGVLLALLSITVFENRNRAQDSMDREAASLIRLVRDLRAYPEPIRGHLLGGLHEYVDEEIGPGWQAQQRGSFSTKEVRLMNELHHTLTAFELSKQSEILNHSETLGAFSNFIENRRLRIAQGEARVPPIMWYVILCGAVMNVILIWSFDLRRGTHAIVAGTLAFFIGLVIYMVALLDQPFLGPNGLKPDEMIAIHRAHDLQ